MSGDVFHLDDIAESSVRIPWSPATDDLHMNVVVLAPHDEIANHTNHALDVVITCLRGSGTVRIADHLITLEPGSIVLIRRGLPRHILAGADGVVYTTVHRKRGGLMPEVGVQ